MNGLEDDQRPWFVIDELDALGAIDGLKDARVRKFGGRCVLGFQI
jgi:type IV secretory pathway TraG/TraD family ATPase VirD4